MASGLFVNSLQAKRRYARTGFDKRGPSPYREKRILREREPNL